ncbi:hypothetical protein WA556_003399 [Blastocystis sp. ATCC 50177/Nand II]
MEVDSKNTVSVKEIEEKVEESKEEKKEEEAPNFPALSAQEMAGKEEIRRIRCPPNRFISFFTPLKNNWEKLMRPVVDQLKLLIRFNVKTNCVELKTSPYTVDSGCLQKGEDYIHAFMLGFDIDDAVALLRLDDLYIETFEIKDVRLLHGDHISRAIGRIAGQMGKTKYAIENATRCRIVLADQTIHILGSYANIAIARNAICNLIMGSPPNKVYNQMKQVAARQRERF